MSTPSAHSLQKQYEICRTKVLEAFVTDLNAMISAKSPLSIQFRMMNLVAELKARRSALRTKANETMSHEMQKFYDSVDLIPAYFNPDSDPIGNFIRSETHCIQLIKDIGLESMKEFVMSEDERIFEVALARTIGRYHAYNLCLELTDLVHQEMQFMERFKALVDNIGIAKTRLERGLGFRTPGEKKQLLDAVEAELSTVSAVINNYRTWYDTLRRRGNVYNLLHRVSVHSQLQAELVVVEELQDDLRSIYDEAEAMSATSSAAIRAIDGVSKSEILRVFHAMMESKMIHKLSGTTLSTVVESVNASNWDNLKSRITHDPKLVSSDVLQNFIISLLNQTSDSFVEALVAKLKDRCEN